MRLVIFFADRLRKWAGSIAQELVYRESEPETEDDNSSAAFRTDLRVKSPRESGGASEVGSSPRGEPAEGGGPPEHWARLVATAPPIHWLELIRQKAPELLSPTPEDQASLPSGEEISEISEISETSFKQETESDFARLEDAGRQFHVESDTTEGPQRLPPPLSGKSREQTKKSSATEIRRTWLDRLRFQPPRQRKTSHDPTYGSHKPNANSPESSTAARDQAVGLDSPTSGWERFAERPDQGFAQETTSIEFPERDYQSKHETSMGSQQAAGARAEAVGKESYRDSPVNQHAARERLARQGSGTGVDSSPKREDNRAKSSSVFTSTEFARNRPAAFSGQLDHSPGVASETARARSSARVEKLPVDQTEPDPPVQRWLKEETEIVPAAQRREPANEAVSSVFYPALAKNRHNIVSPIAGDEDAPNKFASVDRTAPSLIESWTRSNIGKSGSPWPDLPTAATFEIADELAVRENEAEALRRLDQEQRGSLWNA